MTRRTRLSSINLSIVFSLGIPMGCAAPRIAAKQADAPDQAHVVILPGISGAEGLTARLARLVESEVPNATAQVWDWTAGEPATPLENLVSLEKNRRRAALLAEQLRDWRSRNPRTQLFLVGFSGGAGIALFACEALPRDFRLERVILLSGAVSPGYDLGPTLAISRRGVFNYHSRRDRLILDMGTTLFGTTDRVHAPAAGMIGFEPQALAGAEPQDASGFEFQGVGADRVEQLAWNESMITLGNRGGHLDAFSPAFIRTYLLPLFKTPNDPTPPFPLPPGLHPSIDEIETSPTTNR